MEQSQKIKKISSILSLVVLTPALLVYGAVTVTYTVWKETFKKIFLK